MFSGEEKTQDSTLLRYILQIRRRRIIWRIELKIFILFLQDNSLSINTAFKGILSTLKAIKTYKMIQSAEECFDSTHTFKYYCQEQLPRYCQHYHLQKFVSLYVVFQSVAYNYLCTSVEWGLTEFCYTVGCSTGIKVRKKKGFVNSN